MSYENVDKDPDLRKRSDLGPISRPWVPLVLVIGGAFIAVALVVLAGWAGIEWFGWTAGNNANSDKAAAAGAWASAVGATALALASVWIAMQANKHAREAEQRASEEAALTAQP
ncbi:hypothetical protein RR21198_3976 [Rhodococcus rhodochrous ATCC 21198]|uniref:hypothetical protein n=1 Tax=Rhodococcus aetherivorans TaxID=191292 RepID=UPI0003E281F6|nr:hypothetical protein [Rhodococcus aetherivorans]ETT25236.1 hypothetical protein RR21198_3976 [Rhodococcus rhodochrous ATCC 21198]NGP28492.1 hypothetical protein [Rhodococcus aetherivorans]